VEQIEFADVVVLNKCDLVSAAQRRRIAGLIASLNPAARVLQTTNSKVDLRHVVSTGLFSLEKVGWPARWARAGWSGSGLVRCWMNGAADRANQQLRRPTVPCLPHAAPPQASQAPGWLKAMRGEAPAHVPETLEYGISSFVYRARRPFHPGRLYHSFLTKYFLTKVVEVEVEEVSEEAEEEGSRCVAAAQRWLAQQSGRRWCVGECAALP
jgi:G3E family GTPase